MTYVYKDGTTGNEPPETHQPCGWTWTPRWADGPPRTHICASDPGHDMEHQCRCGELYPS